MVAYKNAWGENRVYFYDESQQLTALPAGWTDVVAADPPEQVRHENFRNSDFFDPEDLLQVKYEMLRQVDVDKQPVSQAAKAFGFSRPSFYQAQAAFQQAGLAGLLPQKRGPRSGHKLTGELMQFLAQLRAAEPELSTPQLGQRVAQRFGVSVHPRSLDRQLQRQKKLR